MNEKFYNCPRCNGDNIEDYGEIIECVDCKLEFEKEDIDQIEDKTTILSIQEKKGFIKSMKKND